MEKLYSLIAALGEKKSFSLAPAPEETTTSAATLTLLSTVCRRKINHASGAILMTCQPC